MKDLPMTGVGLLTIIETFLRYDPALPSISPDKLIEAPLGVDIQVLLWKDPALL